MLYNHGMLRETTQRSVRTRKKNHCGIILLFSDSWLENVVYIWCTI